MSGTASTRPSFAPARADGLKPWLRESYHFGETNFSIVYAESARDARNMYGKMHLETVKVRRATVEDVEKHG